MCWTSLNSINSLISLNWLTLSTYIHSKICRNVEFHEFPELLKLLEFLHLLEFHHTFNVGNTKIYSHVQFHEFTWTARIRWISWIPWQFYAIELLGIYTCWISWFPWIPWYFRGMEYKDIWTCWISWSSLNCQLWDPKSCWDSTLFELFFSFQTNTKCAISVDSNVE